MAANRTMEMEVSHRVDMKAKVPGSLRNVWKERTLSRRAKIGMFEVIK